MKNKSYWEKRAARRMVDWQKQADAVADDIAKAYIKATNAINAEIKQIFAAFQIHNGLSDAEARRLLKHAPDKITANSLKKLVGKITDPEKRAAMEAVIESPAYAWRIGRLEALQENVDKWTDTLAEREQRLTTAHYTSLAKEAYTRTIFDIQKGVGFAFQFAAIPQSRVREILRQNWSGTLFSKRIWGNSKDLNQKIMQELLAGFLSGRSYARTAKEIQDQMSVRAFEARRLVRTESTYIANSAELESYKEGGVKKFRFLATLDMRTSAICAAMDGRLFDVEKGVIGVNIPPLHPWCRSTTVPEIDGSTERSLRKRAARDPKTGKSYTVPADMTYPEWKKSLQKSASDGIINTRGDRGLNVKIDKFTPCLEDIKTGKTVATTYARMNSAEIKTLKGWKFDWAHPSLNNSEIYKLTLKNDSKIQGIVALTKFEKDKAVYVNIAESAPENLGKNKRYNGVGGHLFAIAAKRSLDLGYGGFVFMDAKNKELVEHYRKTLGAVLLGRPHPYRMFIDEETTAQLLRKYTFEEGK